MIDETQCEENHGKASHSDSQDDSQASTSSFGKDNSTAATIIQKSNESHLRKSPSISEVKQNEKRRENMIELIDAKLGPSSVLVHRFDIALLEKQALQFLDFE